MKRSFQAFFATCAGLLSLVRCEPADPCDEGYFEQRGSCIPESSPDGEPDGGAPAQDGDAGAASCGDGGDPYAGMGDPCTDQADCPCELNVCNTAFGYCSRIGCMEDTTLCPPDWSCLDVTAFSPEAGSICVAPE